MTTPSFAVKAGLLASVFLALLPLSSRAAVDWSSIQSLYAAGKYEEALKTLTTQPPEESAIYYYNLGTLNLRLKNSGKAVAYLEKANHLGPHDLETQQNLNAARSSLSEQIGKDHLDPASNWAEVVADRVPLDEVRGAFGLLGFALLLLWTKTYLRTRRLREVIGQPSGLLALAGFAIVGSLYAAEQVARLHPAGVSLAQQVVRSGPGDRYLELAQVEAGMKLRALGPTSAGEGPASQAAETWRQVRYSADGIGWVRDSNLLLL